MNKENYAPVVLVALLFGLFVAVNGYAEEVHFSIPRGTTLNNRDWNSDNHPLEAKVGDTLVITNEDDDPHELHALGRPCEHGEPIKPGASWSGTLLTTYNSRDEADPIRDHYHSGQKFWLIVMPKP